MYDGPDEREHMTERRRGWDRCTAVMHRVGVRDCIYAQLITEGRVGKGVHGMARSFRPPSPRFAAARLPKRESFPRLVINRLIIGRFLEKTADERGCTASGRVSPLITAIHLSGRGDDHLSSNFVGQQQQRGGGHGRSSSLSVADGRLDKIEAYQ